MTDSLKIGVCDDNPQDCLALREILADLRRQDEIACFTDWADLLEALRAGEEFLCLFLDIMMPGVEGMGLVSEIEKAAGGKAVSLIFVTNSRDYAVEAFACHAVHYLVKPVRREDAAEALNRIPVRRDNRRGITIAVGSSSRSLYLDEIAVCESRDHIVHLRLIDGRSVILGRMTLENLLQQLGEEFVMLGRGLIVNMNYIEVMNLKSCVLRDGRNVLLSRKNLKRIHSVYDSFTFSRLMARGRD